jgi:AAA+ ATPase superfamily predicted ATPase
MAFGMAVAACNHSETSQSDHFQLSSKYTLIKDDLYRDDQNNLYFITHAVNSAGRSLQAVFINRFTYTNKKNERLDHTLNDLVDPSTWRQLNPILYRDKTRLYCHLRSSGGGYLKVLDASPDELRFFYQGQWSLYKQVVDMSGKNDNELTKTNPISWYSNYRSKVFYGCSEVVGADPSSFKVIRDVDGLVKGQLAKDKNRLYDGDGFISAVEFSSLAKEMSKSSDASHREFATAMYDLLNDDTYISANP